MTDTVNQIVTRSIQLADRIIKEADFACLFEQECADIKSKTERLGVLLRQVAPACNDLYERPTRRIIENSEQVLNKALHLVYKCKANRLQRVFTIISAKAIRISLQDIECSIKDMSWLLRISNLADDHENYLPPIAANEPLLCIIWELIMYLSCGTLDDRANAAASILLVARDSERHCKMIIEEGGVPPLLKLTKEGSMKGQESATQAILLLIEFIT